MKIIYCNIFIIIVLLLSLNVHSSESEPKTPFRRQSCWSIGYNQFYNHRRSSYSPFDSIHSFKQHGYHGLLALSGVLYLPLAGRPIAFFGKVDLGFGGGNNNDFDYDETVNDIKKFCEIYGDNALDKHRDILLNNDYLFGLNMQKGGNHVTISTGMELRLNKISHPWSADTVSFTNSKTIRFNIPLSVQLDRTFSTRLEIGIKLAVRFMVYGDYRGTSKHYIQSSSTVLTRNIATTPLENLPGAGIDIPILVRTKQKFNMKFTPWFNYRPYNEGYFPFLPYNEARQSGYYEVRLFQTGLLVAIIF